jgi:signal transduction histidine kinase
LLEIFRVFVFQKKNHSRSKKLQIALVHLIDGIVAPAKKFDYDLIKDDAVDVVVVKLHLVHDVSKAAKHINLKELFEKLSGILGEVLKPFRNFTILDNCFGAAI